MFPRPFLLMSVLCALLVLLDYINGNSISTGYIPYMVIALVCVRNRVPALSFLQGIASCLVITASLFTTYIYLPTLLEISIDEDLKLETMLVGASILLVIAASVIGVACSYLYADDSYASANLAPIQEDDVYEDGNQCLDTDPSGMPVTFFSTSVNYLGYRNFR